MTQSASTTPASQPTAGNPHRSPVRIRWALTIALVVGLAGVGGVAGYLRTPTYTSTVDLAIGTGALATNSVPGYVQAVETLAGSFSRTIDADAITAEVARRTGMSTSDVIGSLTASPVPDSSIVRIDAVGSNAKETVKLVNEGAKVFGEATEKRLQSSSTPQVPIGDVEAAELDVERARRTANGIRNEKSQAAVKARAAVSARELRARVVRRQYEDSRTTGYVIGIEVVRPATQAVSDRKQQFILFILLGGLLGSVLAVGLHLVRVSRATGPADSV